MSDRPRVLITCPPMLGAIGAFRGTFDKRGVEIACPEVVQIFSEDALVEMLPDFDGWIIGDDPATRRVLKAGAAGRLRHTVKWGIGIDNVDRSAVADLGLSFANTPAVFGGEVADVALGYVIGLARRTFLIDRAVRQGGWPKPRGTSLQGRTVALVGFGDIGRHTARRLLACEMRVVAYDPAFRAAPGLEAVEHAVWPERVEEADVLVLTCALTESNRHMVNRDVLQRVRPGLAVVNVARGPLIDEVALVDALDAGLVGSAALDVFETEPLPEDAPLRKFERCVFGSHNASNTEDAVQRASRQAMDLMFGFLGV